MAMPQEDTFAWVYIEFIFVHGIVVDTVDLTRERPELCFQLLKLFGVK